MVLQSYKAPPNISLALASILPPQIPRVLFALSNEGHEPSEVVEVWKHITKDAGWEVVFATADGLPAKADETLMKKSLFRSVFGAKNENVEGWYEMAGSRAFVDMKRFGGPQDGRVNFADYDAVYLPGGHDKSMIPWLTSKDLQAHLLTYLPLTLRHSGPIATTTSPIKPSSPQRVLGAICHGVLPLAFGKYPADHPLSEHAGKPLLHNLETSTLPMWMEGAAWGLSQVWGMGDYYRTFTEQNPPPVGSAKGTAAAAAAPAGEGEKKDSQTTYTETIVQNALDDPVKQYKRGPLLPTAFTHTDPTYHYVSARFPGDSKALGAAIVTEICASRQRFADEVAAGVYGDGTN